MAARTRKKICSSSLQPSMPRGVDVVVGEHLDRLAHQENAEQLTRSGATMPR